MATHGGGQVSGRPRSTHSLAMIPPSKSPVSEPEEPSRSACHANPILTASLNSPTVLKTQLLSSSADLYAGLLLRLDRRTSLTSSSTPPTVTLPVVAQSTSQPPRSTRGSSLPAAATTGKRPIAAGEAPTASSTASTTTTARAPRGRLYECPACKKRFQRHIALSAHFQNEHIGTLDADRHSSNQPNGRICRLCRFVAQDIQEVREHLRQAHHIDLLSTSACLVRPDASVADVDGCKVLTSSSPLSSPATWPDAQKDSDWTAKEEDPEAPLSPSSSPSSTTSSPTSRAASPSMPHKRTSHSLDHPVSSAGKRVRQELWRCHDCCIVFPNQTLYFLHRGFHSDNSPWRCNGCGKTCSDPYDFNAHLVSEAHH